MTEKIYAAAKVYSRALALTLAFLSLAIASQAQTPVSGTVKDTEGNPLPGVTVIAVGTTTGVTTTATGTYSLNIPAGVKELRFSYVGYEEVIVAVGTKKVIDATMQEALTTMDEVVVVGYGTQKRRDLTGSVASVGSKVLEAMPVATAAEAIAGRMAGVLVTTSEGGPDATIKIRVRGGGSITQDNSPLYIVDGFEVNSIDDISPSDIESIDVLKDASSTAIYGARGANGVVIVTTKSGKVGKVSVNFNAYAGVKQLTKTLDVLSPYEYVMWQYELANYKSTTPDADGSFMKYYGAFDDLELYRNKKGTNWQDEIFGRNAVTQNYNLSVNGGSEKVRYNIGLTHADDQSIMIGSGYKRDNITAKLRADITKKVYIDFSTRWAQTTTEGAGVSTEGNSSIPRLRHALKYTPVKGIAEYVEDDDDYLQELESASELINPLTTTLDEWRKTIKRDLSYNGAFNWQIIKGLKFRSEFGMSQQQEYTDRFWGLTTGTAKSNNGRPVASKYSKDGSSWKIANTLTYSPKLKKGNDLTLMVGQETRSQKYTTVYNMSTDFARSMTRQQALANMSLGETTKPTETVVSPEDNTLSYFGRVNFTLHDKYLLTATVRADGSSKFAPGNRWGTFPSVAVGWRVSDEKWMQGTSEWLYLLKLRASYGASGNNRITDDLWREVYGAKTSGKPYAINNVEQTVLVTSSDLYNDKLKWETTITRNVGLDLGFWNGRLNAIVEAYYNTTKDLLIHATIPDNSGKSYQYQNIGETSNRGIEATLDGVIVQSKSFRLGAAFNIAFNRNRVESLGESGTYPPQATRWYNSTEPAEDFLVEEGKPIGQIYGYRTEGMYTFEDFIYTYDPVKGTATWELKPTSASSSGVTGSSDLPGALKLWDKDGSGTVTSADREVIGCTQPKFTGGFNVNMSWKGFDLAAYFNYSVGNDVYNANKLELSSYPLTRKYGNLFDFMKDRFTYIDRATGVTLLNDIDALKAANVNAKYWSPIISKVPVHSWAVEDGSFLRLSNVTLGYTVPVKVSKKIGMESLRVYVTGYNLALWTNYTGYDPEVDTKRKTPLTPGVDYSAFPRARTIVGGINITF